MSFLFVPVLTHAGILSALGALFDKTATPTSAQSSSHNSQTIPLLESTVNSDPKAGKGGGDILIVNNSALVPEVGPSGTVSDLYDRVESSQISVYTVRTGDTLSGIAEMFDVSVNTIVWANDIVGGRIRPGDVLVILPITGIRHTIVKGETFASLAKKYKGDAEEIAHYNSLELTEALAVGTVVIIPDGTIPPPAPAKTSAGVALKASSGPLITGYYGWPVDGGVLTQGVHGYNGIDIGARTGTNIFAAASGVVIVARGGGGWNGGYGNYLVIQHDNGTQTLYAHASALLVGVGDQVSKGQTIAKVGATGKSTGAHLHFEVRGAANPFAR